MNDNKSSYFVYSGGSEAANVDIKSDIDKLDNDREAVTPHLHWLDTNGPLLLHTKSLKVSQRTIMA